MQITLRFEGPDREITHKTFSQEFVSGRIFRKTLEMQKLLGKGVDEDTLDIFVDYVVLLFGKQFTLDEFYDGIEASVIVDQIVKYIDEVIHGASKAVGADPSDPN